MRHHVLVDAVDLAVGTSLETSQDPVSVVLGLGSCTGSMGLVFPKGSEHGGGKATKDPDARPRFPVNSSLLLGEYSRSVQTWGRLCAADKRLSSLFSEHLS